VISRCAKSYNETWKLYYTSRLVVFLQVLDSVNVNSTELAHARNKYTGRLQKEVVEECVGYKHLEALQVNIKWIFSKEAQ